MKPNTIFDNFLRDLSALYCKTKLASIENEFIKLAQSGFDYNTFGSWLSSELRTSRKGSLLSKLSSPNSARCILELNNLTFEIGKIEEKDFYPYLIKKYASDISFLNNLFNCIYVKDLYTYYSEPLNLISNLISSGTIRDVKDDTLVKNLEIDYRIILSEYENAKSVMVEKSKEKFLFLLNKFSNDVAGALTDIGREDLAQQILSSKILWRPDLLSTVLPMSNTNRIQGGMIGRLISDIIYKQNNPSSTYEYIKSKILDFAGVINKKDIDVLKNEYRADKDLYSMQEDKGFSDEKMESTDMNNISSDKWLDPNVLTMISSFLYGLYLQTTKGKYSSYT